MKIKIPNKYLAGADYNGNNKDFSFDAEDITDIYRVFPHITAIKFFDTDEKKKKTIYERTVYFDLTIIDTIGVLRNLIHNEMAKIAPPCFK